MFHSLKRYPSFGVAVSVTTVPAMPEPMSALAVPYPLSVTVTEKDAGAISASFTGLPFASTIVCHELLPSVYSAILPPSGRTTAWDAGIVTF